MFCNKTNTNIKTQKPINGENYGKGTRNGRKTIRGKGTRNGRKTIV